MASAPTTTVFEARLPRYARSNVEARLHAVCCEHARLLDFRSHQHATCLALLAKVKDLMLYDWHCIELAKGLMVTIELDGTKVIVRFSSPCQELADFLNSLSPAVYHPPSDDAITD